jgi:hypothetical protein
MKTNVQDAISKLLESDGKKEQVNAAVTSMLATEVSPAEKPKERASAVIPEAK